MSDSLAKRISRLPVEEQEAWLDSLEPGIREELARAPWWFIGRPEQQLPAGDWRIWLMMAGRGFGKTRGGAEALVSLILDNPKAPDGAPTEWAVFADTFSDCRTICVEGPSGILRVLRGRGMVEGTHFTYNRSMWQIIFTSGQVIHMRGADSPDVGRGLNLAGMWCVAAGELVATERGHIPIEEVCVGDRVWTRDGLRLVTAAQLTNPDAELIDIHTESGDTLRCTPDHVVWADNQWKRAESVCVGDSMELWKSSMDRRHGLSGAEATGHCKKTGTTRTRPEACSTSASGNMPTSGDLGQTKSSTTSTTTGEITTRRTSRSCQGPITFDTTWRNEDSLGPNRPVGSASGRCGLTDSRETACANGAESRTSQSECGCGSARDDVLRQTFVKYVERSGKRDAVYDLTIEGAHEFYASNLLVHNCDEIAKWSYAYRTWVEGVFPTLRIGKEPRAIVTTTPKPGHELLKLWVKRDNGSVVVTKGSIDDNRDNLSPAQLAEMHELYDGTRIGRQELMGEFLEDVPGALWNWDMIKVKDFGERRKVVVAVDPAVTNTADSDETGIVVAGKDTENLLYVMADVSCKDSVLGWAKRVNETYERFSADLVVYEDNQGGDAIKEVLLSVNPFMPLRAVRAKVSKHLRAEPIAALYEQGKVFHTEHFDKLENQMLSWEADDPKSPDRLDAMVHALTALVDTAPASRFLAELADICQLCGQPNVKGSEICHSCHQPMN